MSKIEPKAEKKALSELAKIPTVSSDFGLGYAHNVALDLARLILTGVSKDEIKSNYFSLHRIFQQWKNDFGTPRRSALGGLLTGKPSESLSEVDRREKIKNLEPWDCHKYSETPISLFNTLLAEKYRPITDFIDQLGWHKINEIKALLILDSHNSDRSYQNSDCIREALTLAKHQIYFDMKTIEKMEPILRKEHNRRIRKKMQSDAKKANTEDRVKAIVKEFEVDNKKPTLMEIQYKFDMKYGDEIIKSKKNQNSSKPKHAISTSQISKILTRNGLGRYKLSFPVEQ